MLKVKASLFLSTAFAISKALRSRLHSRQASLVTAPSFIHLMLCLNLALHTVTSSLPCSAEFPGNLPVSQVWGWHCCRTPWFLGSVTSIVDLMYLWARAEFEVGGQGPCSLTTLRIFCSELYYWIVSVGCHVPRKLWQGIKSIQENV